MSEVKHVRVKCIVWEHNIKKRGLQSTTLEPFPQPVSKHAKYEVLPKSLHVLDSFVLPLIFSVTANILNLWLF